MAYQDEIDAFDRRVRTHCRAYSLDPSKPEEYVAGYRAVLMNGGPHVEAYARGPLTVESVRALLVKLAKALSAQSGRSFEAEWWSLLDQYPTHAEFIGWSLV